jgi:uncharacterized membrane protein YidH (DUF202 family)
MVVPPPGPGPDEPAVSDPANRTRLAWTRTAVAFAAIGAAMLKNSPIAGAAVLVLSVPIWAVARRTGRSADAMSSAGALRLVTATVVLIAIAALIVALTGHSPGSLDRLLHDT